MQMAQKTMTNTRRAKSARPFANRSKQWTSNIARPDLRDLKTRKEAMSAISR